MNIALLEFLRKHADAFHSPETLAGEMRTDLKHLLSSWFNRGFLQI